MIRTYRIDATFTDSENGFSYSFYFLTPEPIETEFSSIINKIANEKKINITTLETNYFDVVIVPIGKV